MSDEIDLYALYTREEDERLRSIVRAALDSGWELETETDGYVYSVGEQRLTAASVDDVLSDLRNEGVAEVRLTKDGFRVRLGKDHLPNSFDDAIPASIWAFCSEASLRPTQYESAVRANVEDYLDLVRLLVDRTAPDYAFATSGSLSPAHLPTVDELRTGRIPWVYWLNVFSTPTIERLGRDRIRSAPSWRTEAIGDDHVVVVTRDSPVGFDDEWRYGPEETMTHLSRSSTEKTWRHENGAWREEPVATWLLEPSRTDDA